MSLSYELVIKALGAFFLFVSVGVWVANNKRQAEERLQLFFRFHPAAKTMQEEGRQEQIPKKYVLLSYQS